MSDKTYNGWTNYETWAVALWIDNEQGSHERRREMAQECWDTAKAASGGVSWTREEHAAYTLATCLRGWIEEENPLTDKASLYSDLLSAALSEVNWDEIARNWIEDVDQAGLPIED